MPDTTLETPQTLGSEGRQASSSTGRDRDRAPLPARYAWWLVALAVIVIAAALLRWANTRPGYDPYGWLDWGYQTLRGSLNLGGAPSWKPFTYIFDVPYALFGHYALYLWMLTSVSLSLAGAVFAGRIAYRLTAAAATSDPIHPTTHPARWPAIAAAVFAGASVLGIQQYFHYVLSVQSDSMLVSVCLAAIDMYLCRRLRWAFWLGVLAGLGRPEVWPFLAVYGLWLIVKRPGMRWMVFAGAFVTLFLWFGVPTITNGQPNIAGALALKSPRECGGNKIACTVDRFVALQYVAIWIAALLSVGLALVRRNRTVLTLAAMVAGWVVIEIAFVLHGFPGVPRYLFEAGGLAAVLAGTAVGWLLLDASRFSHALPRFAGIPVAAVLVAVMIPQAISTARAEHKDINHERARTQEINKLGATIAALGGPNRVTACGHPVLNIGGVNDRRGAVEYVSIFGWYMHLNTGLIGYRPKIELVKPHPIMVFSVLSNGWGVTPIHQHSSSCASLKSLYVPTARHPQGVLVPR